MTFLRRAAPVAVALALVSGCTGAPAATSPSPPVPATASGDTNPTDPERLSDRGSFRDLFELRIALEVEAAGLAATHHTAEDLARLDVVGFYANYAEAHQAWLAKARETLDNAQMRYFIVHLHRLLDPAHDEAKG